MKVQSFGFVVSSVMLVSALACKDGTPSSPSASDVQVSSVSDPVFAKLPEGCKHVRGNVDLTNVPSPNDPLGRSIGPSTGKLKGAASSVLTSIVPQADESIDATSTDVLVAGLSDVVNSNATTTYTPILGAPLGTVSVATTQTIVGGTGKYAGATGTLVVTGIGHNLYGPDAGPGNTNFELEYDGTICI